VHGTENLPEKGGLLLLSNHVSYLDGPLLVSASPRPVRFLMIDECYHRRFVGLAARLFQTIPVSPARSKEAIRFSAEALQAGEVVALFPEGQLTRTGGLSELKGGFALIARRSEVPVIPVYLDGLWGSMFSFAG